MRLPADATLIVVGAPDPAGDATVRAKIAALIEAWRREDLPAIDAPASEAGAFDDDRLEAHLEDLGATTLVLCGEEGAVDRAARDAAALGFHAFVVSMPAGGTGGRRGSRTSARQELSSRPQRRSRRRQSPRRVSAAGDCRYNTDRVDLAAAA